MTSALSVERSALIVRRDSDDGWHGPGAPVRGRWHWRWSDLLWQLVYPRNGHRILPTASGLILIGLAIGIGVAAYNSANNILFITLSLLLACLFLSGLLSWLNLRGVAWRLQFVPPLRAGHETLVTLELRNGKAFLPTYGLWFDLAASAAPRPPADGSSSGSGEKKAKARPLREILAAAEQARTRARLFLRGRLDPAGTARLDWVFKPARRGVQRLSLEGVGSFFPFGFLRKQIGTSLRREVIVWPATVEYQHLGTALSRSPSAGARVARAGSGGDLLALRKYAPGDSHRLIHWKASARLQQLLVRQFTAESQETFAVWLQTPAAIWIHPGQFELLLGFAASLAEDLFRAGKLSGVALNRESTRPVRRVHDLELFLDRLAVIEPVADAAPAPLMAPEPEPDRATLRAAGTSRKRVITFVPEGIRGVAAYVDGEKTAAV